MADHNIDVQSVFSWAPKVVRKCESKHWFSCGADGRLIGRSVHTCVRGSRTPFHKIPQGDFNDDCRLNASQVCVS